jgi:ankyrin repeat protein
MYRELQISPVEQLDYYRKFLETGAYCDCKPPKKITLYDVAYNNALDMAKLLFEYKVEITPSDFYYAISEACYEITKLYIENGIDVNCHLMYGLNPLQTAFRISNVYSKSRVEIIKLLIDAGADIKIKIEDKTLLGAAIYLGDYDIVKLLLEAKADVNQQVSPTVLGIKTDTPIKIAFRYKYYNIVELLLEYGAVADKIAVEIGLLNECIQRIKSKL